MRWGSLGEVFSGSAIRRKAHTAASVATIESLEQRQLLTIMGAHELEVVGRGNDGNWLATGFDWDDGTIRQSDELFANWNPAANWTDVLHGDFDGDGLDDLVGRDPDSGYWWASLADGVGSTTILAGAWSSATTWTDVAVVNLPNPKVVASEGALPNGKFDVYRDLVGRASDGTWWAALANGDGTFTNAYLAAWNAGGNWRDVLHYDHNGDGATDMIGRTDDGTWWATTSEIASDGRVSFTSQLFATWNEAAGWRDVMYVPAFSSILIGIRTLTYEQSGSIVGRTSTGEWWAMRDTGGRIPERVGTWNEAAGWRDVQVLDNGDQTASSIVGRTSTGGWYQSLFDGSQLVSERIGQWDETAEWRDVQTVAFESENRDSSGILGRNAAGIWQLLTQRFSTSHAFENVQLGMWNESAGWSDVQVGEFTREAVTYGILVDSGGVLGSKVPNFEVWILARRAGVDVFVENAPGSTLGFQVTYRAPTSGFMKTYVIPLPPLSTILFIGSRLRVNFDGHIGGDRFVNRATFDVSVTSMLRYDTIARGRAGNDLLDSTNDKGPDSLFGGPGLDVLLGDSFDMLTQ